MEPYANHHHEQNAKYFGPGIWYVIHVEAIEASTTELIKSFLTNIELIVDQFPCQMCRFHAKEYLTKFPPRDMDIYVNKNEESIGMFFWSWNFHNAVNRRLNKPHMSYRHAHDIYRPQKHRGCQQCQ